MCRSVSIFAMLLAHAINLVLTVCVVRCVGADGRESFEFFGQSCFCHAEESEVAAAEHVVSPNRDSCCSSQGHAVEEGDTPTEVALTDDCDCEHSPIEAPCSVVERTSVVESLRMAWAELPHHSLTAEFVSPAGQVDLRHWSLRPCQSPHLPVVAMTVLRV